MPTVVTERPYNPVPMEPPRKKWTRAECVAMEASGVWDQQQRLELVEGDLINKMGKNRPHTNVLIILQGWLIGVFGLQYVNPETPIDVAPEDNPTSEPQPDLIVLAKPSREFRKGNPQPADIRLAVEISDSTLSFDRTVKARLYARAGIVEYWVVDVAARSLVVHRDPLNGLYQSVTVYNDQESVSPLASPGGEFPVGDAFPPPLA
jgi:Uma2 family endonuclease